MVTQLATPKVSETKASEYLAETLLKRNQQDIQKNLLKMEQIKLTIGKGYGDNEAYKSLSSKNKALRRSIGALVISDPKASEEMIVEMGRKLLDDSSEESSAAIVKFLKGREGRLFDFKPKKGVVGHHPTALSVLRDALAGETTITGVKGGVPFDVAQELKALAKRDGIQLGEELIAYLDPSAHAEQTKHIRGLLKKKNVSKQDVELLQQLVNRSAHARVFGGTRGIPLFQKLVEPGMSAEDIYKLAKPYLELSAAGTKQGLALNKLLFEADWNNADELLKLIKETPLPSSDVILNDIIRGLEDKGHKVPNSVLAAFTDKTNVPPNLIKRVERLPSFKASGGGLFTPSQDIDIVTGRDLDTLDLTKPFAFSGDSAGALTMDRPGLLSGTIQDILSTVDKAIPDLPNLNVAKARAFGWMINKGPQKFLQKQANELAFSTPISLLLDKDLRQKAKKGNYVGFGSKLLVDHAIGEATWHGGKAAFNIAPLATTAVVAGTGVGLLQHAADERIRKNIDPNWWSGIGGVFTAPIGYKAPGL
tara:strand:- start:125 stop:1732 length:1608 start_codon:yes stop_codon:yes gene_type:complete